MFSLNNKVDTDPEKIESILTRNVEEIFIKDDLRKKLLSGDGLTIKLGFDPTGDKIHIGRAIVLRKLREFQDLGHQIVFLVGNFTAQVGDPSDKLEKRPMLDKGKVESNLKNYKAQIGKVVDLKKARFVYNADWLGKLGFQEIAELAEGFTVNQMLSRRNFKDRFDKGEEISVREFMYPLMQGYDSYVLKADVELGGTDQLFNLQAGRTIQKHYGDPEQNIMTTIMLEGTDGRKMSTSWGNVINITDEPNDMFGKVMSLNDALIPKYFRACTDVLESRIKEIEEGISLGDTNPANSINPKDAKKELARAIVTVYHSTADAKAAENNWENTFSKGDAPDDVTEVEVSGGTKLVDVVVKNKMVDSKSEWRRLVEQGGVSNMDSDKKVSDLNCEVETGTYKIGKRRFIKVVVK